MLPGFDARPLEKSGLRGALANAIDAAKGAALIGYRINEVTASARTAFSKFQESISLFDFMAPSRITAAQAAVSVATAPDVTAEAQAFLSYLELNHRKGHVPAGWFKITEQLNYAVTSTDADVSSGVMLEGEGMGKTIFVNAVDGEPMLMVTSTSPYFAKGNLFADFTILGDGVSGSQTGIRSQGAWYTQFLRVRIIKVRGSGVVIGDDSTTINPDDTANAVVMFEACEIDQNIKGINNPVNNNAPIILIDGGSLRNNTEVGLVANSSHIVFEGTSIAFNGSAGSPSALGGIHIEERSGTTYSAGYRSKDVVIRSCEIDSNAPYNINVQQAERLLIEQNTLIFHDYPGTWMADLATWPTAQIQIGGSTNTKRVLGATIRNNRVGFLNEGNIAGGMNGHSILRVGPYGQNVKWYENTFDITPGTAVMGTDCFIIREDSKAGTSPDLSAPRFHVDYDYPVVNGSDTWLTTQHAFNVPYRKVFAAQNVNTQFQILLNDDTAQAVTVPSVRSECVPGTDYGFFLITASGQAARSDIIGYRAVATANCFKLGAASSADINVTTGVLAGTTGTDGKLTVSAHTDGKVYIENRLGSQMYVNVAFLMFPGLVGQPIS